MRRAAAVVTTLGLAGFASVIPAVGLADPEPPPSLESVAPAAPETPNAPVGPTDPISSEETPLDQMDPATRAALQQAAAAEQPELRPASLPGGEAKSGVTPQALSLPNDGGSFKGLGESFSPLLSSGTATFSVPIALPPGRRGTQPGLSLSYGSSGGNGPLGIGWSLAVPFVSRQTDLGLPRYDGTDRFMYNGGQELVEVAPAADVDGDPSNGLQPEDVSSFVPLGYRYFRARVEGAFLRFFLAPDESHWVVQDRDGTYFYLGETADSRVEHGSWGVFSWSLTRVLDQRGNEVRYLYRAKDRTGAVYLDEIIWNSPIGAGGAPAFAAQADRFQHSVRLFYESRLDSIDSYLSRWLVTTALRLSRIEVSTLSTASAASRTFTRSYAIAYDPESFLSLPISLQVVGRGGLALPPMTFGYSQIAPAAPTGGRLAADIPLWGGFDGTVHTLANSPPHSLDDARTDLFDIDADAFPDVLVTDPARYGGDHGVFFLDFVGGVGTYGGAGRIDVPSAVGGALTLSNTNVNPMDLDADGRVELLHMPHLLGWSAYDPRGDRSAGFAWVRRGPYPAADPDIDFTRDAAEIRLVDADNDRKVDILRTSGGTLQFFRNRGDGGFDPPVDSCVLYRGMPVLFSSGDLFLADMNGDGVQDLVHLRRGDIGYWPGRGYGLWGGVDDLPGDCPASTYGDDREVVMAASPFWSDLTDGRIRLSDVNADGLSDIVQTRFDGVDLWLNEAGRSFTGRYIIERTPYDPGFTQRLRFADVNATGSRDIVWGDATRYRYMDLTGGIRPRLLTRVDNGLGKTTDLEYLPHTAYQAADKEAGQSWTDVAPFPVQVVSRMTVRDNLGGAYVTEYAYRDALYDGVEAEFRGFGDVTVRTVGDANSPTSLSRTLFWRGERPAGSDPDDNPYEALKGAVRLTETCDETGTCLETSHTTYRVRRLYDGVASEPRSVWFAYAEQSDTFRYDTSPFRATAATVSLPAIVGDAPAVPDDVRLRGTGWVQLQNEVTKDAVGQDTLGRDLGNLADPADDVISHATYVNLSDWLWRRVRSYVEPNLRDTTYLYNDYAELRDQYGWLVEEARSVHQSHKEYTAAGLLALEEEGGSGPTALRRRRLGYDPNFATHVEREEVWVSAASSLVTTAIWDPGIDALTSLTDFSGQTTSLQYDGLGRLAAAFRPGCPEAAARYEYRLAGDTGTSVNEVITRANERCGDGEPLDLATSLETRQFLDGLGRERVTFAEADTARGDGAAWVRSEFAVFDAKGGAAREHQPDFVASPAFPSAPPATPRRTTSYDAFGRVARVVEADEVSATETAYHALSRDVWDPNDLDHQTPTTEQFDGQDRTVALTERNLAGGVVESYVTAFSYDALGDLRTIERSFGTRRVSRSLFYDSFGRRIRSEDPDSGIWRYVWSDVGDLARTEDPRGTIVAYGYDLGGRLATEDYGPGDGVIEVRYVFDEPRSYGVGRLTHVVDRSGETRFYYDARGREATVSRSLVADGILRSETRSFDEMDRETLQVYPDGSELRSEYSARGLLYGAALRHDGNGDGVLDLEAQPVLQSVRYNAAGRRVVEILGDLAATRNDYAYDVRLRIERLTSFGSGRYLQDWRYGYDRSGNITVLDDGRTLAETDGWSPRPASHRYAYDALDRLRVAETTYLLDDASRPHRQSWSHDFLGNMVEWTDEQNRFWDRSLGTIANGIDTAAADPPSALVSASLDAQNHLEATYGAAGDMETLSVTRGGATTLSAFAWDEVHRLVQATVSGRVSSFTYDYADTRRVKDGTRPDGTAERVLYAFDDFEVRDGEITKWVIVGSARVLRVTTRPAQADVAFYLSNHLGTTSVVIGASGAPVSASSYLPYGAIEAEVVSVPGFDPEYRFTGKERDDATGLDYFGARYYAANLGRWLSPDPPQVHEPEPEIQDGAYAYVANNPLIYRDPDGQVIETIADVVGLGVDVAEMVRDPSLANAGMLAWSLAATAIPFLPGSWTLRAAKAGVRVAKAVKAARQADRVADAARAAKRAEAAADVARAGNRVQEAAQQTKQAVQRTKQASKGAKVAPRRRPGGGGGGGGGGQRPPAAGRGGGRGRNNLRPDPAAQGPHSTFKRDPQTGRVTGHAEWQPNPRNPSGFDQARRVDTQYANPHTHHNRATGQEVPTPHAHDRTAPGGVRPALPEELPQ